MSEYWLYEDMIARTAKVHRGECKHCNHGAGTGRGRKPEDSRWLGPYGSEAEIRSAPTKPHSTLQRCLAIGNPCRDDPGLAWLG